MAMRRRTWSMNALATEFGMSLRRVAKLIQDIPPCGAENGHPVWYMADVAHVLSSADKPVQTGTIDEAERRKTMAEAQLAEMKLAERQAVMMDVREVQAELERAFGAVRAKLLAIPSKLAPVINPSDPAKVQRLLEVSINETLVELQQSGDDDGQPADEAAAEPDIEHQAQQLPPAAEAEPVRMGRRKP